MRLIKTPFILVSFVLVSLLACSKSSYEPLSNNATVLAFGDSLTAGVGTTKEFSYPNVLAELSGRRVINAGISGEVTSDGLKRLPKVLQQHQPQLLILMEGGNDILRNQSISATKANLAAMIELAQTDNIPVLLMGIPEKSLFSDSADFYQQLADEYGLIFMDDLVADLLRTSRYKSDPVHLNKAGYKVLAEAIYEHLQDQGLF